jgi:hypothetical protein
VGSPLPAERHLYEIKLGSQVEPLDVDGVCAFIGALRAHEALAGMSLHRV